MTLADKVRAYRALSEMMAEEWEFSFIYPLIGLMGDLSADYEFFSREEMKLVSRYGKKEEDGTVAIDGNGGFDFADAASAAGFSEKHRELSELTTADPQKTVLKMPPHIKGEWLRALMPFCRFVGEEGERDGSFA